MAVPYLFSNVPGGTSIPLAELDANFAYLTSGTPTFLNLNVTGDLTVGGTSTLTDLVLTNSITIGTDTVVPTGITGTGKLVFNIGPTLVAPLLGTPASGNLANCTNFPVTGLSGLGTNVLGFLTAPSSSSLRAALTDETGTGSAVFNNAPTLINPDLGTPSAGILSNCTGYPGTAISGVVPIDKGGTNLTTTGAVGTVLMVTAPSTLGYVANPPASGVAGGAASQLLYQADVNDTQFIPNGTSGQVLLSNGAAVPSWGQVNAGAAITGVLPFANGGTSASTRQSAIDALAGSVTSGRYLRGNGTNIAVSAIQVADVPILNQNTTGSASTFTSTIQNSQFNSIGVNVAASGTPGSILATGNIQTTAGNFSDSNGTLHPLAWSTAQVGAGTEVLFTGIPSYARRVTLVMENLVTPSNEALCINLGTGAGMVVAGYSGASWCPGFGYLTDATRWLAFYGAGLPNAYLGVYVLHRTYGNSWVFSNVANLNVGAGGYPYFHTGTVALPGALTQIKFTASLGSAFGGGTVNIAYE